MCAEILNDIANAFTWNNVAAFLNSNFTSALAGALAGAFAGAIAAQRIANRENERKELLAEIRSTNAAIVVAFTISNSALVFKKQLVKDICDAYDKAQTDLQSYLDKRAKGLIPQNSVFDFRADFHSLQVPLVPIDTLRKQVYERISAPARPLALVATLASSLDALEDMVQKRNELIERFRVLDERNPQFVNLYFGIPYGGGHVNTEYKDSVEAIGRLTDDAIFFSHQLAKDLEEHGNRILDRMKKLGSSEEVKVSSADFTQSQEEGLMPDSANYSDWLMAFKNKPQSSAPS